MIGIHILAELFNCEFNLLNDLELIKTYMIKSCEETNLTIVNNIFHKFQPIGVTGVLVLSESHFSIHTWPEKQFCAVDIFTCSKENNPLDTILYFKNLLMCEKINMRRVVRHE